MHRYIALKEFLDAHPLLSIWGSRLEDLVSKGLDPKRFGDLPSWQAALDAMPTIKSQSIDLAHSVTIGATDDTDDTEKALIKHGLQQLIPWRKGPFTVHGTVIDTEWRSDWKWDRALPHINPLHNKLVLDVGCGNGYHCLRMLGAGAKRVIGIDPSPRFVTQFYGIKKFAPELAADVIPATLDDFPTLPAAFDTVFSMGVLYHRPSPIDHLRQLKDLLAPGGQLVLETLVVNGPLGHVLVPEGRYAMMNNVWFLPSPLTLISWLNKLGFVNARVADVNTTQLAEQRQTEWMHFHSLEQFLDPADHTKTAEGHPAPTRAIFLAELP